MGGDNSSAGGVAGNNDNSGGNAGGEQHNGGQSQGGNAGDDGGNGGSGGSAGSGGDAGMSGSGGEPVPDGVPVFVAQGRGGRILISCDNGQNWSFETKQNDDDGDHTQFTSHGVVSGKGMLVAAYGWGAPALLRHSLDGQTWVDYIPGNNAYSEMMYQGGVFVAGGGHVGMRSTDGINWEEQTFHMNTGMSDPGIVRAYGSGTYQGEPTFVGAGANRFIYSPDAGRTWTGGTGPGACATNINHESGGIVGAEDGVLYIVNGSGTACVTRDGGRSWSSIASTPDGEVSELIYADGQLFAYLGNRVATSTDGSSWNTTNLGNANIAHVGYASDGPNQGSWAASNSDGSRFYTSSDGLSWSPAQGGSAGTTINTVIHGYIQPGGACP